MENNKAKQASKVSRKRPRICAPCPKFATIVVGPEEERFVVHEELLTYHSGFFRAALTGKFKEGQDKTVTLSDDSPQTFEFFVFWLYHRRFPSQIQDNDELAELWNPSDVEKDIEIGPKVAHLVELCILADQYQVPTLTRAAMDELFDSVPEMIANKIPINPALIRLVFGQLPPNDKLCQYLIDMNCQLGTGMFSWKFGSPHDLPYDYVFGLAAQYETKFSRYIQDQINLRAWVLWLCDYHVHNMPDGAKGCKSRDKGWVAPPGQSVSVNERPIRPVKR